MWHMPHQGSMSRLTFDSRLASGLSRARQKVRIRIVQRIGLRQSDASSECPNTRVPMFGMQTVKNRDEAAPQLNLSVCTDRKIVILYV